MVVVTNAMADPKLIHLVGRILSSDRAADTEMDIGALVQTLCQNHREYQRKDVSQLTRDVQSATLQWQQLRRSNNNHGSVHPNGADTGNNMKVKKRKQRPPTSSTSLQASVRHDDDDSNVDDINAAENDNNDGGQRKGYSHNNNNIEDEEDEYDRAAMLHDTVTAASTMTMMTNGNNSLNDRLLQIRNGKPKNSVSITTNGDHSTSNKSNNNKKNLKSHPNNKSTYRIDIVDTQHAEISESFADHDDDVVTTDIIAQADFHDNHNKNDSHDHVHDISSQNAVPQSLDKSSSAVVVMKQSSSHPNRKRKLVVRRSSSSRTKDGSNGDGFGIGGGGGVAAPSSTLTTPVTRPTERYSDLGGMDHIITVIRQLIEYPITRPELYRHLGVDPPRGVLLRGPPGTGKTHLANAVAGQLGVPFFRVSAPELVAGVSGESESRIRALFQAASDIAPSLIFLDEIDAVAPNRGSGGSGDSGRGMEKRMVAQLLTSMDSLAPCNNRDHQAVLVLAATNRPDALDPALRRAGRFDKEILLGVPDEEARIRILRTMTKGMRLHVSTNDCDNLLNENFDYKLLARRTPGFVGADIRSLTKEAAVIAINRIFRDVLRDDTLCEGPTTAHESLGTENDSIITNLTPLSAERLDPLYVTMDDFLAAVPLVQPSSQREGFASIPDVSWENIGALQSIREELSISVLEPIRSPEKFKMLGLQLPAGVLLYGPPGCGKTLLAKAIAHESGANFISVKGPELLDKYIGESERAVRLVFERARCSSPCIIFFDELDSIVPRRGSDHGGGGGVTERVVNQLLTEMDGLESRRSVFIIAATNRPELIDPAMLRPGRLDKLLYVPLPTSAERVSILRTLGAKVTLGDDVDLEIIGSSTRADGYSGADLAALLREAGLAVLKEHMAAVSNFGSSIAELSLCIKATHFETAFHAVMPSVSKKDHARYDKIRDRMAGARSRGVDNVEQDTSTKNSKRPAISDDSEL